MDVIERGKKLKRKACKLYSFSKKEKDMMRTMCIELRLSSSVYAYAEKMYLNYLENTIDVGVGNPKYLIAGCIYIAAIKERTPRNKVQFEQVVSISLESHSIIKWIRKILSVVNFDISLMEAIKKNKGCNFVFYK